MEGGFPGKITAPKLFTVGESFIMKREWRGRNLKAFESPVHAVGGGCAGYTDWFDRIGSSRNAICATYAGARSARHAGGRLQERCIARRRVRRHTWTARSQRLSSVNRRPSCRCCRRGHAAVIDFSDLWRGNPSQQTAADRKTVGDVRSGRTNDGGGSG